MAKRTSVRTNPVGNGPISTVTQAPTRSRARTRVASAPAKLTRGRKQATPDPRAAVEAAALTPVVTLSHEQIATRAVAIWERKGRPIGLDDQNWREAEAELRAELAGTLH